MLKEGMGMFELSCASTERGPVFSSDDSLALSLSSLVMVVLEEFWTVTESLDESESEVWLLASVVAGAVELEAGAAGAAAGAAAAALGSHP